MCTLEVLAERLVHDQAKHIALVELLVGGLSLW